MNDTAQTTPALDEHAKRRDDFREGVPVILGDGQEWHLKPPPIRYTPVRGDDGKLTLGNRRRTCPTYQGLIDQAAESSEGTVGLDIAVNLIALVLQRNYDLTDTDLADLLPFEPESETNESMWGDALAAAMGTTRPKL